MRTFSVLFYSNKRMDSRFLVIKQKGDLPPVSYEKHLKEDRHLPLERKAPRNRGGHKTQAAYPTIHDLLE